MRFLKVLVNRDSLRGAPRAERLRHFMMDEHPAVTHERSGVPVFNPRIVAEREREVEVFVPVVKTLVPAAYGLEGLALHEHAEPGEHVNVVHLWKAPVPPHALIAHDLVGNWASGDKPAVVRRHHEPTEPVALHGKSVVVQEEYPRRIALLGKKIVSAREMKVLHRAFDRDGQAAVTRAEKVAPPVRVGLESLHDAEVPVAVRITAVVQQVQGVVNSRRRLREMGQETPCHVVPVKGKDADVN